MTSLLLSGTALLIAFTAATSNAAPIPAYCEENAASSVESKFSDDYDREGFEGYKCEKSPRGKAVVCEVAASKGDGAAIDTYRVILNASCSKTFRVELIGEE